MLKYSIVDFCSDLSLIKGFVNQDDLFDEIYHSDDERILTIYIKGILDWHTIEALLIQREIIQSGEQLISLFCRSFESEDEILSLYKFSDSIVFL